MQFADEISAANDESLQTLAPEQPQRPHMAARPQDLFDSLHHAQAAFSDCLGRYLEL